ncbi:MAG TPA: imidazolonepropionase [Terriglobales bacterium]|nr:imidazolonepropionase [Terriglobales bacterium]
MKSRPLLLVNIGQLLTLRSDCGKPGPRRGPDLKDLGILEDAAVLCLGGKIVSVGKASDALRDPWLKKNRKKVVEIDCEGQVVLPGFVDSHTHPAFMTPRLVDFEKRIAGANYEEIAAAGGGIRSSIEAVRKAGKSLLAEKVLDALHEMADQGTTTVEAKSGYGLNVESELKSLEAIRDAAACWPGTVVSTLLGAHVVPPEFKTKPAQYVKEVCDKMIPQAAKRKLAQFVDVFTDRGAFSAEDTEKIFEAARKHGLGLRAHVCQLSETALWPLLRFHPASFDHMDHVNEDDIPQLAKRDTIATLVPGANYFLGLESFPPARKLIDAGVPVALATDYNPGSSPTPSMPFVLSLACTHMKMSPAEAIAAATINGAWALRLQETKGSVEPGKDADLAVFEIGDYREIAYWFASNRCASTVLNGTMMASGGSGELE